MTDRDDLRDRLDDLEASFSPDQTEVCDDCGEPVAAASPSVTAEFAHYGCVCDLDPGHLYHA